MWSFDVIMMDDKTKKSSLTSAQRKGLYAMIGILCVVFISSFFLGHYGVYCSAGTYPYGLMFMSLFQLVWSPFALYNMKTSPLMKANKEGVKEIFKTSKTLALDSKKKEEHDEEAMKEQ